MTFHCVTCGRRVVGSIFAQCDACTVARQVREELEKQGVETRRTIEEQAELARRSAAEHDDEERQEANEELAAAEHRAIDETLERDLRQALSETARAQKEKGQAAATGVPTSEAVEMTVKVVQALKRSGYRSETLNALHAGAAHKKVGASATFEKVFDEALKSVASQSRKALKSAPPNPEASVIGDVAAALRNLGYDDARAEGAADKAHESVGAAPFELLFREALRLLRS